MKSINDSTEYNTTFAALKLIEYLYHSGMIQKHVFQNILREYSDRVDISAFML